VEIKIINGVKFFLLLFLFLKDYWVRF